MAKEELKSALYFFNNISFRDSEEMINLALACNYQLVDGLLQNVKVVNKSYYFGKGKVEEFKTLLNEIKMPEDTPIILNVEVSGTQKRNLEEVLGLRIIDRTELILNIFESRAKTTEAKLQVEIAKLHYLSSKLVDEKANYSQVTSGTGHNKGKGETNKELSQREILSAIKRKEKQLENIKKSRKTGRNLRNSSSIPVVAVVGYTNAGKSTLVNSLINFSKKKPSKNVLEKDMLFATLETSSRLIDVYNYPSFIISDTVGFVSRLPYYLIAAFRSTLEEIKEADYIIHVIDASSKYYDIEMEVTNFILEELEHAKKRGATIYAELAGYGSSCDAYHITAPLSDGSGAALAVKEAIADAGLLPGDVDYYNAHGTSTKANDVGESCMIKSVFGDYAKSLHISSTKSMTGHLIGAAGAIEAFFCLKAINESFIPPTINLKNQDIEAGCDLDYTANRGIECQVNVTASASLGFGGHNACIILKKYTE